MTNTYKVISHDVWGNEEDGYTVNQSFTTSHEIELADEASDKDIENALKGIEYLSDEADTYTDGENEFALYVYRASDGYPLCELRPITENN